MESLLRPGRGAKYCDKYVYWYACLSVKHNTAKLHHIFCMLPSHVALFGCDELYTSEVLFAWWMTSYYRIMDSMANAMQAQNDSPGVAPTGAEKLYV